MLVNIKKNEIMVAVSKILDNYLSGKLLVRDRERFELLLSENYCIIEKLKVESSYNYSTLINIFKLAKENIKYREEINKVSC